LKVRLKVTWLDDRWRELDCTKSLMGVFSNPGVIMTGCCHRRSLPRGVLWGNPWGAYDRS